MATATAHHYATVNPCTGEVVREFDSLDAAAVDRAVALANATPFGLGGSVFAG